MTIKQMQDARLGKGYWGEYVKVNGYSFSPTDAGIFRLARLLDLTPAHLRKCINQYLAA